MEDRDKRLGERVRHFRQERGWTQDQLAAAVESRLVALKVNDDGTPINREMVRKWEKGENKLRRRQDRVDAVAHVLEVTVQELLEGRIESDREVTKKVPIRILGDLEAGNPCMATGNVEWLDIDEWENPENQRWGRRLRGESMWPILKPRDICIFEDRSAEQGDIIHAYHPDQSVDTIKLYKRRDGRAWLDPHNEIPGVYDPIDAEQWRIRGPLMEVHRKVNGVKVILRSDDGLPLTVKDLLPFADQNSSG